MAVTLVKELFNGRTGDEDPLVSKFVRVFLVHTDNPSEEASEVQSAAGIPEIFDDYETPAGVPIPGVALARKRASYISGSYGLWEVTCEYDSGVHPDFDGPLLARPLEVRAKIGRQTVTATVDFNGTAIRNSAGEPFDPAIEMDETFLILSMTRFEASFQPDRYEDYVDTTNSVVWNGFAVGTCLMRDYSQEMLVQHGDIYWRTSYEVHVKKTGWKRLVLDKGYRTKLSLVEKVARDERSGEVYSTPVLLDGAGGKLPANGTPVFLEFTLFPAVDWTPLGLLLP